MRSARIISLWALRGVCLENGTGVRTLRVTLHQASTNTSGATAERHILCQVWRSIKRPAIPNIWSNRINKDSAWNKLHIHERSPRALVGKPPILFGDNVSVYGVIKYSWATSMSIRAVSRRRANATLLMVELTLVNTPVAVRMIFKCVCNKYA